MTPEAAVLPTLSIDYDPWTDVATIERGRYAGGLFRGLGHALPAGALVRVQTRADGVLTLYQLSDRLSAEVERLMAEEAAKCR
jgi:hypothetical protein